MSRSMPHVAIDVRMIDDGGIGTYLQNVIPRVAASRPDWRFTLLGDARKLVAAGWPANGNVTVRNVDAVIYSVREQIEMPLRCPASADLLWCTHYNIPVLTRKPIVVTVHDVCHLAFPKMTGGILRRLYANAMFAQVRRRAKGVLFDSEFSRTEMGRLVGDPRGSTAVSHLAVDDAWFSGAASVRPIAEPYLVYVGNMKRHKNVPMLLRAFRMIQSRIPHRLVLIGRAEGLRADPAVARDVNGGGGRITIAGELSPLRLRDFVAHADAFVTASLYEGFGLPPLEAMAAGCPCVVSSAGSLPEICRDAALYCDPRDPSSVARAILDIVSDGSVRARLVERGRARARQFSWDACAERSARLLETALT